MDDTARWQAIESLLDDALDQPAAQRIAFVRRQAADAALAERVIRLLEAEQAAGDFLESTPPEPADASAEPPPAPHRRIGPWAVGELLGRGGMGEVYRAERDDGQYRQTVALKLIRTDDPAQAARFESERQILARLGHPNIARLIDGGLSPDGRPYMAMEYVAGRSLGEFLRTQQPDLDRRLDLFGQLCAAVGYAHAHLVVHRDIKPDNVLIDEQGRPRLLDFGIAKLTRPGLDGEQTQALATPNYAAPEQLTGGPVTTATDVYGLGATLYFLLCEQPPLQLEGASLPQLLDRLQHSEPAPPSRNASAPLRPELGSDLDAICARAMHKDPQARYSSVEALAEDLRRFRQHEPIRARPPGLRHRLGLYLRRHRLAALASLAVSLSLIIGLAAASWQAHEAARERDQARRDAARLATMQSAIMRLFRSASSEKTELTARELFTRSAAQIEADFADDPATATQLMAMLGELLLSTEDYATARDLLQRARARYTPDLGERLLASISIDLAHLAYRDGDLDRARRQYTQAADIWAAEPGRFRAERIWAATLASQLARADGRTDAAVAILQQAAADARLHWGPLHQETGIVLINLAVAHYYANRLPEALDACAQAWRVWQAIDRTDSPDALNLLANWGLFALRHGDPVTGERRLAEALNLRSDLYGPSAALATLMKNLGIAHRLNGRRNAGMRLLEQGEWMAEKYAGAGSRLHASASVALARALIEDDLADEARSLLAESITAGAQRSSSWHDLSRVVMASLQDPTQDRDEVEAQFAAALASLEARGDSGLSHLADALQYRARWLAASGRLDAAIQTMDRAITSKQAARRDGHYEALLMQAEQARLRARQGDSASARSQLAEAQTAAAAQFGPEHAISRQLQAFTLP